MATFSLGNVPSPIQQATRLAQLRELQNPNLALERQIQQAVELQRIQQQSPEGQLALQLKQAQLESALQNQAAQQQQQAFLQQQQPLILKQLETQLQALQNPNIALEKDFNEQLMKSSFDPVSGVRRAGVGAPPVGEIEPIINPITGAETPFVRDFEQRRSNIAKATALKGPTKVGNQLVQLNPVTQKYDVVFGDAKPATVSRFSDSNGFLFNQSTTGGPATPVLDGEGEQINIGVANQVISTDQGVFTLPKKSGGGTTTSTDATGLQPLTGPGGTPLTKTTGKGASGAPSAASKQFLGELATNAISTIDDLNSRTSRFTTGIGSLTKIVPESPAADYAADLETLASDIRLGILQQMKSLSKTGASGLGALSDREGKVLESSLGSIRQDQSPTNVKKNLAKIRASISKWNGGVSSAAPEAFGTTPKTGTVSSKNTFEILD